MFLPSYGYAGQLCDHLGKVGIMKRISAKKKVFRDGQGSPRILEDYAACIRGGSGALLFSVVGGKLSEGINFSDDLARCVIMVGMPHANPHDPELCARMEYLNRQSTAGTGDAPGRSFYENLCMKAVNQSIGRAIRHRGDYASVANGYAVRFAAGECKAAPVDCKDMRKPDVWGGVCWFVRSIAADARFPLQLKSSR